MASPLLADLGRTQGRLTPAGWLVPEGSKVLCLGSDAPGHKELLRAGQGVTLQQTADVGPLAGTPHTLVAFRGRLRGPSSMPSGWKWVVVWGDSHSTQEIPIPPGRTVDLYEQVLWVRETSSPTNVRFQLRLDGPAGGVAEVELPAFYIDALSLLLDVSPIRMVYRFPENGHTDVPRDQIIRLDLANLAPAGAPIDLSSARIFVNGTLAYDGASFLAPFTGPGSSASLPSAFRARFALDRATPFDSEAIVTVTANLATTAGDQAGLTWSFSVVDETPPMLLAATPQTTTRLRVSFNEPMLTGDGSGPGDALNPHSYAIEGLDVPYFVPDIVAIERLTDTAFDIVFSEELSPGVRYMLAVVDARDVHGNAIAAPHNNVTFTALRLPAPRGRSMSIYELLPQANRDEDQEGTGDLERFAAVLQEVFALLVSSVDRWTDILDFNVASERFLDAQLAALGNPFRFFLTVAAKRRLLAVLGDIYKQKGTDRGIVNVVRFFVGVEVTIERAVSDGFILGFAELGVDTVLGLSSESAPYSFYIRAAVTLTDEQRSTIRALAVYMKPSHTHFLGIEEPALPEVIDHMELGLSELGTESLLH